MRGAMATLMHRTKEAAQIGAWRNSRCVRTAQEALSSASATEKPQETKPAESGDPELEEEIEHATGNERAELEAHREGIDPFFQNYQWIYTVCHCSCTDCVTCSNTFSPAHLLIIQCVIVCACAANNWHERQPRASD